MRRIAHLSVLFVLCATLPVVARAAGAAANGTADEAKAMVDRALAEIKAVGPEKAFVEFSTPGGKWQDRDLYLFGYDMTGTCVVHGANKALIGKNLIDMKTADGQLLIKTMVELTKSKGSGWIDYLWPHPQTKKTEHKSAYVVKIPGYDGFIGAGIYK